MRQRKKPLPPISTISISFRSWSTPWTMTAACAATRSRFTPQPDMLKNGTDPLLLIRQLRQMGELELTADAERLPDIAAMQPDVPYVAWTGTLRSTSMKAQVEEVFEFASDCEVNDHRNRWL